MEILIVEDELKVANAIKDGLTKEQYTVIVAPTGEDAIRLLAKLTTNLVILDLGLPGCDGVDVLQSIRQSQWDVPVLILSARDSTESRILGLDAGADDYLVKPFEFAELVARVRAISRRGQTRAPLRFKIADLEMDVLQRKVTRGTTEIDLTNREFQILECLFRTLRQPVSRKFLVENVWKGMPRATPLDNVIDVHMARLRHKVDAEEGTTLIRTIRGVGFVLTDGDS